MMPKRPRSHELEDESRRAFADVLPSGWVVRHQASDYGVDEEVEVFENGLATGLTFKVQLKGTDSELKSRDPYVRVSRETANYWQRLDVPVLVVLYAAKKRAFYSRWAHSALLQPPDKRSTKTLTISFDSQNTVGDQGFAGILADLKVIRAVRRGRSALPLPLRISVSSSIRFDNPASALINVRTGLRRASDVFAEAPPHAHSITLEVTDKIIQARMPTDLASATLQYLKSDYTGDIGRQNLLFDCVLSLSSLLAHENSIFAARMLMDRTDAYSRTVSFPTVAVQLFKAFYGEGFTAAALSVACHEDGTTVSGFLP